MFLLGLELIIRLKSGGYSIVIKDGFIQRVMVTEGYGYIGTRKVRGSGLKKGFIHMHGTLQKKHGLISALSRQS